MLIDIDQSKVIAILEERTQSKIMEVLGSWGEEIVKEIEYVSIDLWKPYRSLVEKLMPNAVVVADRFHVMKQINGLSRHLGEKSIINYKIIGGGLRRESRFISLSSKLIPRLTHPTHYKILLSP